MQKQSLYRHKKIKKKNKEATHSVIHSNSNLFLNYFQDHLILKFRENNMDLILKMQLLIFSELVIKLYDF